MLGPYALTSLAALKEYLNLSVDTYDNFLENLIDRVTGLAENYTNRKLLARDYSYLSDPDDATIDGNGIDALSAPQSPINSITTLRIDEMTIPNSNGINVLGYIYERRSGIIMLRGYLFTKGLRNVELIYNAGYTEPPGDLEEAVIEQSAWFFKESSAGQGFLGVTSKTLPDGSINFTTRDLLSQVRLILDKYKGHFVF